MKSSSVNRLHHLRPTEAWPLHVRSTAQSGEVSTVRPALQGCESRGKLQGRRSFRCTIRNALQSTTIFESFDSSDAPRKALIFALRIIVHVQDLGEGDVKLSLIGVRSRRETKAGQRRSRPAGAWTPSTDR